MIEVGCLKVEGVRDRGKPQKMEENQGVQPSRKGHQDPTPLPHPVRAGEFPQNGSG